MKKVIASVLVIVSVVLGLAFTFMSEKEDKLSGNFQVFVNSFKLVESTEMSPNSFKDRTGDSLYEGFQLYTFDFDSNIVTHEYLLKGEGDQITDVENKSKIKTIESDGEFAYLTIEDKSYVYSKTNEKYVILNLNSNPKYPMVTVFWKNKNTMSSTYSIDTNPFDGLFTQGPDPSRIFND
jgi:uncharacterized protein YxeA